LTGSRYAHLAGVQHHPDHLVPAAGPVDEVAVDVLARGVEVARVQQHRRAALAGDGGGHLVGVGLAGVAAEREHRNAQVAEPGLQLADDAVLFRA